jgi:IgA Peptidase M64/Secretion system C-terminal sorting domain
MKKQLFFLFLLMAVSVGIEAQSFKFPVDTLIKTGTIKRRVNVVILPDGYTAAELSKFKTDANTFISYLFQKPPFDKYKPYFSVYTVAVPSAESGVTHPQNATDEATTNPQPKETKDTYFGSSFDTGKIHRLLSYTKGTNLTNVLATNFPSYDIVFVIVNTPYYGGAGGFAATFSLNAASNEIGVHELGHSFPGLADEYYAGAIYDAEKPNMTKDKSPATNRWKNWLGTPGIGIFDHTSPGQAWAKPANGTCRMEFLNKEFCSVCRENFVEKILKLITPVESQLPATTNVQLTDVPTTFKLDLLKPNPNSLQVEWFLDGKSISTKEQFQMSAVSLPNNTGTLVATVYDSTAISRSTVRKITPFKIQWNLSRGAVAVEPFIITANKLSICSGDSVTLSSTGCTGGVITWSNGGKGASITVKPSSNFSYTATCEILGVPVSNTLNVSVTASPTATASNKGPYIEYQTIELTASGGDTYEWKGSGGFSSTVQNPTIANAKVANAGVYTVTAKRGNCANSSTTSVKVDAFALTVSEVTPQAVCVNGQISLTLTANGALQSGNVNTIQLSDNQGANFKNITTTLDNNVLKATIPSTSASGTGFKVRVVTTNPVATSAVSVTNLTIKPLATAKFVEKEIALQQYLTAEVKLLLTGETPQKLKFSDGQSFDFNDLNPTIKLTPNQTTEYKISSVNNVCGEGIVSADALKITVTPVLGNEPIYDGVEIFPNPTEQSITITLEKVVKGNTNLELIDIQGRAMLQREITEEKTNINLQTFPAGTYLLRVLQGEKVLVKKVVKK